MHTLIRLIRWTTLTRRLSTLRKLCSGWAESILTQDCSTGAAINLAFAAFTILMVFVEMILFCTHRLAPVANIVMQCIKSAVWTFYLIITIIAAAQGVSHGGFIFLVLVILFVPHHCPVQIQPANLPSSQLDMHRPSRIRGHHRPPQAQRHALSRRLCGSVDRRSSRLRAQSP